MTRLLSILLLLVCGSALGQNVTNFVAGQKLWDGMQLTTTYDLGCADCTNLVINPGFDTGAWSPWLLYGQSNATAIISSDAVSGPNSAQLFGGTSWSYIAQTLNTVSNKVYTISMQVHPGPANSFQIIWAGVTNVSTSLSGGWMLEQTSATATNSTTQLKIGSRGGYYLLIDDVSVLRQ